MMNDPSYTHVDNVKVLEDDNKYLTIKLQQQRKAIKAFVDFIENYKKGTLKALEERPFLILMGTETNIYCESKEFEALKQLVEE